jgi:hypothetical protein
LTISQQKCEAVEALPPLPHTKILRFSSRAWRRISIAWFTLSRSTVSIVFSNSAL